MKRGWNWFKGLGKLGKLVVIGLAFFGFSAIAGASDGNQPVATVTPKSTAQVAAAVDTKPVVTTKQVQETEPIAFSTQDVNDSTLTAGNRVLRTAGVNGVKTKTFAVTYTDGTETGRTLVSEATTTAPIPEVTAVGTRVAYVAPRVQASSSCDPNYSGACVPIASDVDCSSGTGNGPAYVVGPITVVGVDIYDLDRDGNGTGCENG